MKMLESLKLDEDHLEVERIKFTNYFFDYSGELTVSKHLISKSTLYLSRLWYIQRVERDWQEPGGRASLPQRHAAAGSIPLTWAPKVA